MIMGMTQVNLIIKNPKDERKTFEGKFLVDSGATYTVVPATILKNLGIKSQRTEEFSLADGKIIKREVGSALYRFEDKEAAAPVLFGQKGDSFLLGAFTLEALGLSLDPLKRTLHKTLLRL